MYMLTGTILNVFTVLLGAGLGLLLGQRLPARIQATVFDGLGLVLLLIGLQMALQTQNVLVLLGGMLLGGLLGGAAEIESRVERFGAAVQARLARGSSGFSEAFVASSLLFCVGPLTITGSIQNGLTGDYSALALKSMLDLFSSFALAASLGPGVLLSAVTVLVFQGGLALGAGVFQGVLQRAVVTELTAAGGLLIVGIGIRLLGLKPIRVANFLPALVVAPLLLVLSHSLGGLLPALPGR